MENKNSKTYFTWESQYIIKMANFLKNNNISLYNEKGEYKGVKDILAEVNSKFENS